MNSGKKLFKSLSFLLLLVTMSSLFAAAVLADGATVYNSNCAGCHRLGTVDTSGSAPDLLGKGSSVDSYYKAGVSGHKSVTLTATNIIELKTFINNPTTTTPLSISTSTLAGGTVAVYYSQTLVASGGKTPYTWARSSGTLPTGLTLGSTGVISGTPTATGTFNFTVMATDSASTKASVTKALSITIAAAAASNGATVYNGNCAGCHRLGTVDTSGSAPDLLGKGSSVDSYYKAGVSGHKSVTLTATNITELKAYINNPTTTTTPLAISTSTLAGGTVAVSYNQTLVASGGKTPYTWARSSGTLPGGLTISSTGVISGTPTATGTFNFTVRVRDSASTSASVTKALTITVSSNVPPLSITTTTMPHGTVGTAYSQSLVVTGGLAPYAWSYNGTLPAGIVVTSAGLVTGTPTVAGSYSFTVLVTDSRSTAATQGLTITIASVSMTTADKTLFINNCSNCHTPFGLEKRTAAQIQTAIGGNIGGMGTSALKGLSGASLDGIARSLTPNAAPANDCSSCHSATPPPPTTTGQGFYDANCAGCHRLSTYDTSGSAPDLYKSTRIDSYYSAGASGHQGITISATDITNLKAFLNAPTTPTPPPTTTTGQGLYDVSCAGCHSLGTYDTSGTPNLLGRGSAVAGKFSSAHYGITLNATDISNVTAFINNPSGTPPPTPACGSCHAIPPSTGSHSDHRSRSCSTCHGSGFSSTTVNTATHNNGVKNVVTTIGWNASTRTCSNSCHGSEKW